MQVARNRGRLLVDHRWCLGDRCHLGTGCRQIAGCILGDDVVRVASSRLERFVQEIGCGGRRHSLPIAVHRVRNRAAVVIGVLPVQGNRRAGGIDNFQPHRDRRRRDIRLPLAHNVHINDVVKRVDSVRDIPHGQDHVVARAIGGHVDRVVGVGVRLGTVVFHLTDKVQIRAIKWGVGIPTLLRHVVVPLGSAVRGGVLPIHQQRARGDVVLVPAVDALLIKRATEQPACGCDLPIGRPTGREALRCLEALRLVRHGTAAGVQAEVARRTPRQRAFHVTVGTGRCTRDDPRAKQDGHGGGSPGSHTCLALHDYLSCAWAGPAICGSSLMRTRVVFPLLAWAKPGKGLDV